METAFLVLGFALIIAALMQFAFWTGRLVRLNQMEQRRFETGLQLLKAQLDEISARRDSKVGPENLSTDSNESTQQNAIALDNQSLTVDQNTWTGFRKFRVARLEPESKNAMSVCLEPVDSLLLPTYKPGQHITIRVKIPGCEKPVVRCYTLSDAPGNSCYRLTIKRANAPGNAPDSIPGLVSNYFNDQVAVGDLVEVKPPSGRFVLAPGDSPIVLLAGGIGITPMMSILQHLANTKSQRQCLLIYGVRHGEDATFAKQINRLTQEHNNIHVIKCFSRPLESDRPNEDYHVRGFASIELLRKVLPTREFDFYLCGPPPFMTSLYNGLIEWGVPDSRIHFESFGPATIQRRGQAREISSSDAGGQVRDAASSTVKLARSGKQLDWNNPEQTLLELCEENGVLIDSGCRAGNCGTCQTRLISGSVGYEENVECDANCILPCVAKPNGSIEIDA